MTAIEQSELIFTTKLGREKKKRYVFSSSFGVQKAKISSVS